MRMTVRCLVVCTLALATAQAAMSAPAGAEAVTSIADAITELKFRDFFALPIGPHGLVPSARLLGLAGQRVRVVGYMVRQEQPSPGLFILAPLPVALGDEDEAFADDLPAATLYVHLTPPTAVPGAAPGPAPSTAPTTATAAVPPWQPGLVSVTGRLDLGAAPEPDGRLSFVRLQLDPAR